jgi:TonB dependent receptor
VQANRKIIGSLLVLLVAAGLTGSASAQGVGGGLRLDTPGIGLELEPLVTERFGIRGLVTGGSLLNDWDESGTRYDGKSRFGTGFLLADWHPYATGFRLSGGLAYSNQRFVGATRLGAGTININGAHYSSAQVGSLDGRVTLSRVSPYLGVGWGLTPRARSGLYFSADLGVMYQRPSVMLMSHCGPALPASLCAHDLRAEEAEFLHGEDHLRLYPVISVGFGLRF